VTDFGDAVATRKPFDEAKGDARPPFEAPAAG